MIDDSMIDNMELDELQDWVELLQLDEVQLEEDNLVHDIANEIEDIGDQVKEEAVDAPCNYVTPEGVFKLELGQPVQGSNSSTGAKQEHFEQISDQ